MISKTLTANKPHLLAMSLTSPEPPAMRTSAATPTPLSLRIDADSTTDMLRALEFIEATLRLNPEARLSGMAGDGWAIR